VREIKDAMSRVPTSVRTRWRAVGAVVVAGVTLAGCGTVAITSRVMGYPSINISVPLNVVACTTTNTCLAVGASGADVGLSTVGEVRRANGSWTSLYVPPAQSSVVTTAACWSNGCLIGGTQPSGTLLWRFSGLTRSVRVSPSPHAGQGVTALSCFAIASCAAVDTTGVAGHSRLSFTRDGGATWTTPLPMAWSEGATATALSCSDTQRCLVATTRPGASAIVEATTDGGATWSPRTTSAAWRSFDSLTCVARHCVALVATANGPVVARTTTFAESWGPVVGTPTANALACRALAHCVLVGQTARQSSWLATLHAGTITPVALQYAPSPLSGVACGTRVCAAIAISTVLSLRP